MKTIFIMDVIIFIFPDVYTRECNENLTFIAAIFSIPSTFIVMNIRKVLFQYLVLCVDGYRLRGYCNLNRFQD